MEGVKTVLHYFIVKKSLSVEQLKLYMGIVPDPQTVLDGFGKFIEESASLPKEYVNQITIISELIRDMYLSPESSEPDRERLIELLAKLGENSKEITAEVLKTVKEAAIVTGAVMLGIMGFLALVILNSQDSKGKSKKFKGKKKL